MRNPPNTKQQGAECGLYLKKDLQTHVRRKKLWFPWNEVLDCIMEKYKIKYSLGSQGVNKLFKEINVYEMRKRIVNYYHL